MIPAHAVVGKNINSVMGWWLNLSYKKSWKPTPTYVWPEPFADDLPVMLVVVLVGESVDPMRQLRELYWLVPKSGNAID